MSVQNEIVDPLMTISCGPDLIVRARWTPGVTITEAAARRSIELLEELSSGQRLALLVDMSDVRAMTREARTVFAGLQSMLAMALVGKSPVVRVISNFALGVIKPGVPSKFFTSTVEAESWLRGFQT